jgi:hypothetical protein
VVIYDPDPNPKNEEQAIARCVRACVYVGGRASCQQQQQRRGAEAAFPASKGGNGGQRIRVPAAGLPRGCGL